LASDVSITHVSTFETLASTVRAMPGSDSSVPVSP
jgi:hypothetical protein